MRDYIIVTGMILKTSPVNDYDRRLVILTKERGKITVFARGARRQGNKTMAASNPFCFGNFKLLEGRDAYNLMECEITHYFEDLRSDFEGMCLGSYFLEYADYYARENNDETLLLKLLFQSIRAILKDNIDNRLVRSIFEIKILCINGEFPGLPVNRKLLDGTAYAVKFIESTPVEKVYSFALTKEVLDELDALAAYYRDKFTDKRFLSLDLVENLC